jgi:hypothetical protein
MKYVKWVVLALCIAVPIYAVIPQYSVDKGELVSVKDGLMVTEDTNLRETIWFGRITKGLIKVRKGDVLVTRWFTFTGPAFEIR